MRLFISINFDEKTKENILAVQRRLMALGRGRFTSLDNLHLTLAFLGEVLEERIPELKSLMDGIDVPDMHLTFCEVGAFRNESELWWIGIKQNDQLAALQTELIRKLQKGIKKRMIRPCPYRLLCCSERRFFLAE